MWVVVWIAWEKPLWSGAVGATVGNAYDPWARYYDWIYEGLVDYEGDVDFLESTLQRYGRGPTESVLDLGCGTGGHSLPLARRGYRVVGVDSSRAMLTIAGAKVRRDHVPVEFRRGDMRDFRAPGVFDAALCMFGAFGYLTSGLDARRALLCARRYLRPGGLYLCELWNTAAVIPGLTGGLRRERDGKTLLRLSEAAFDSRRELLTITFRFYVLKDKSLIEEFDSIHRSRTYRLDDMRALFRRAGLQVEALIGVEPMHKALDTPAKGHFRVMAVTRAPKG